MMIEYNDLLGRQFELSRFDCFTMVSDFYLKNYGISITNYARPKDWSSDDIDIIGQSYPREGFSKVQDWSIATLQPGDLLAMAIGSSKANHLAIYIGQNKIVHHLMYQLSREEILRDFWRKSVCYVLRHNDVSYEEPEKPTTTIEELLNARYHRQIGV